MIYFKIIILNLDLSLTDYACSVCPQLPLEAWEGLVEGALWPRGPLHPTHHVVLQAKVEMVSRLRPADGPAASGRQPPHRYATVQQRPDVSRALEWTYRFGWPFEKGAYLSLCFTW